MTIIRIPHSMSFEVGVCQELIEESGDCDGLSMVSSIQVLQEDKKKLHQELLEIQENYEAKLEEVSAISFCINQTNT